ncbi:MAG: hypothetical protein AB7G47_21425 [Mycolicibacterium sp.]|uniref:hypothetical protein n=1 Tax=Mycolicibacterium sp. TaxID=2320850 RepID=UPI003D120200
MAQFLGWDDFDPEADDPDPRLEQAEAVIAAVASLAKSYTRGEGWTTVEIDDVPTDVPASDINTVILTASARLIAHPQQLGMDTTLGPQSARWMATPFSWSLGELMTLNRYRKTAM